jgi:hypothetical protein
MHTPRLRLAFLMLAVTTLLVLPGTISAQSTEFPIVPDPAECQVEPRTAESLAAVAGTPSPAMTVTTEADLPQGEAADEETVAAIVAAERLFAACYNAGDYSRLLSLLTDHAVLMVTGGTPDQATIDLFLTPATPTPAESWASLIQVRDVRVLGENRVGAIAENGEASDPGVATDVSFRVFVKVGDRWLLDDEVSGLPLPNLGPEPTIAP